MEEAKSLLMDKGIPPSLQRILIMRYLLQHKGHPAAEEVYKDLSAEIPTLSKTTVYNTLKLFREKGILKQLAIFGNEQHYETEQEFHGHFKCSNCGEVYDVKLPREVIELAELKEIDNHVIEDVELILRGVCRKCRGK